MIEKIFRNISNIPGWRSDRKIIVIESDDWGSIRMPSKEIYSKLLKKGIEVDRNYFTKNDSLESNDDLLSLYDLLSRFKDKKGNHPVFTGLAIVANPDFDSIRNNEFQNYTYEALSKTVERYNNSDKIIALWKEGISRNIFIPQFHGREHLNVNRWMADLQRDLPLSRLFFEMGMTRIPMNIPVGARGYYQAAFDIDKRSEIEQLKNVITDGIEIFYKLLGFKPEYFCPPNGPFNKVLESHLFNNGFEYINTAKIHLEPIGDGKHKKRFRYLGKVSKSGLIYLTRNVAFEPGKPIKGNWVDEALKNISISFRWKKPAVISTHRVNYIGRIDPLNRMRGLKQLEKLLSEILRRWPDVEFLTSMELGRLIKKAGSESKYEE